MTDRICVVGASGLLGRYVASRASDMGIEVVAAVRDPQRVAAATSRRLTGLIRADISREEDLDLVVGAGVGAVINCAGLIKPLCTDEHAASLVNALAPHHLADRCSAAGVRLVHVSTDCVFRGDRGRAYLETDEPDADDVYGSSKALGEVVSAPHLTVRTSFIGHEAGTSFGLLDWFLNQKGQVRGFSRHLWTGLGAVELADILLRFVGSEQHVTGLVHVAGPAIDKKSLLELIGDVYGHNVRVVDDDTTAVDRRLSTQRLASLGISVPPMRQMVEALRDYAP